MITNCPVDLKDVVDIRWIKKTNSIRSGLIAKLNRRALEARMTEEALINHAARIRGYNGKVDAPQYAHVETQCGNRKVLFTGKAGPGSYRLQEGVIIGKAKDVDGRL